MEKEEEKEGQMPYCPLLSIGQDIFQPCIEEDCMWFIKLWDHEKEREIKACAIVGIAVSV